MLNRSTPLTLVLLRHGETVENRAGITQGHMDGNLTDRGRRQAKEAAVMLREYTFDAIYTSDLGRCIETASIVTEALGLNKATPDRRLRELSFGIAEGKRHDQPIYDGLTAWAFLQQDYWHSRIENGESNWDLQKRLYSFVNELIQRELEQVLVVTHGGPIRHLLAAEKGFEGDYNIGQEIPNSTPIVVKYSKPLKTHTDS